MKKAKPRKEFTKKPVPSGAQGTRFTLRDLCATNPLSEQFEPTEASPIPNHKRMGGVS